ncbi:MATE family efflux transporter [bacterium]|nr:MATE family efflux transporter [bacterium]
MDNEINTNEQVKGWEIMKKIIKVSFPMLITNASFAVLLFCDRMMLAHYELDAAGASMGAGVLSFTVQSFFAGVALYTTTLVAQYFGAKDKKMVSVSIWQSLYFVWLIGCTVPWISRYAGIYVLELADHAEKIQVMEKAYFSYMAFYMIIPLTNIVLSSFFNGRSMVWVSTISNVFGCAVNVFLNYVFIFGKFGAPEMGITGAAVATIIAGLFTTFALVMFILFMPSTKEYHLFREWRFRKSSFLNLLRFGLPTGLMFGLDNAAFSAQIMFTGRISDDALNATTVTFSIQNLIFMPILSVAAGAAIIMAQYIGMDRKDLGKKAVYQGLWLGEVMVVVIAVVIILFTREIFNIFCGGRHTEEVYVMTRNLLYLTMLFNFLDVVNIGLNNALRSAGDTIFPMVCSVLLSWLFFVPALYVSTEVYHLDVYAVWCIMGVLFSISAIIYWIRFRSGKWQKFQVMEKPNS